MDSPSTLAFLAWFLRGAKLALQIEPLPHSTPHLVPNGVFLCALFRSYYCSQPDSIYQHLPCTVSINKVLACNWSHNPPYCTECQYLEESLPLHQSDPYLKASNLPYISLINSLNFLLLKELHHMNLKIILFLQQSLRCQWLTGEVFWTIFQLIFLV